MRESLLGECDISTTQFVWPAALFKVACPGGRVCPSRWACPAASSHLQQTVAKVIYVNVISVSIRLLLTVCVCVCVLGSCQHGRDRADKWPALQPARPPRASPHRERRVRMMPARERWTGSEGGRRRRRGREPHSDTTRVKEEAVDE